MEAIHPIFAFTIKTFNAIETRSYYIHINLKSVVMKTVNLVLFISTLMWIGGTLDTFAQERNKSQKTANDSIDNKRENTMMLNASSATSPRDVNIGLPAAMAGTSVNSNGLPTMYRYWPTFPFQIWRTDTSIAKSQTYDLFKNAIMTGEVGVAVNTFDNLGTDKLKGSVSASSNTYGLFNSTGNISAPLDNKGTSFSVGYYLNYDPGTLDMPFKSYYSDQAKLFKGAITRKYNNGKGKISLAYKYMTMNCVDNSNSPFYYNRDGTIDEIPGIKIGKSSFYESSGKGWFRDVYTGEDKEIDLFDGNKTTSNDLYVIGENTFGKQWKLEYHILAQHVKSGRTYIGLMGARDISDEYVYLDDNSQTNSDVEGTAYRQMYMHVVPVANKTLSGRISATKKWKNNELNIGTMIQLFNPGTYTSLTSQVYTDINTDPRIVYAPGDGSFDEHGYVKSAYNANSEYVEGKDRKYAIYAYDTWDVSPRVMLKLGARLEYQRITGLYAPNKDVYGNDLQVTARNSDNTLSTDRSLYYDINKKHLNFAFNGEFIYRMTNPFGWVGGIGVTKQASELGKYRGRYITALKPTETRYVQLGLYLNQPWVELVSKATYIKKNNTFDRQTLTLGDENITQVLYYDMETIGWTTDFLFTPFYNAGNALKKFKLHFLFTIQDPKYKNYGVEAKFSSGTVNINYSDQCVTKLSKVLMEIDPSFAFDLSKKVSGKVWLSGRYYGKQYANLSNSLYYAAHWETFGGLSINYKKFEFSSKFTNLLNQKGVTGTIGGTDLMTDEQIDALFENGNKPVFAAAYIRPFSIEFGLKYRF